MDPNLVPSQGNKLFLDLGFYTYEREEGEHPADDVASNTLALGRKDLTASVAVPEEAGNLASST